MNSSSSDCMRVKKRNGELEEMAFDKILNRLKKLGHEANIHLNYTTLAMKVIDQLYDGMETGKIDELAAEQCASMSSISPDYGILAGRIVVSNHQKNTDQSFTFVMEQLYNHFDSHGIKKPLLSEAFHNFVQRYSSQLDALIVHDRDYLIDFFGFKTLERAYLFRHHRRVIERIQHMWLRVAVGIHMANDVDPMACIKETYDLMSKKYFIHATPTLFNAGTPRPQMSSCYLIKMESDSIEGIYDTLKDCALISKYAGGIGLHIHNIRAKGSPIIGTNGTSNGVVPMLKVFNSTARYVDQCVAPETIIYTTDGPIEIQNCVNGRTKVFNLQGNAETIENVLEHSYTGKILNIENMHCLDNLRITPEHPVFVLANQTKTTNYSVILNRLQKNIVTFEWVAAKDLAIGDFIVYSIPQHFEDIPSISTDDCYMYGIILGDGSINNNEHKSGKITLHTENKADVLAFARRYLDSKLIPYAITVDGNVTNIRWNKNVHLPFKYSDCYSEDKAKRVHPRWLNLPIEKSKFILKGLLMTDGTVANEIMLDSTSRNLVESMKFIALKMGALTSDYTRDRIGESHETARGTITNQKISYCLRIPKKKEVCELLDIPFDENNFFKFLRYGNYLLSRIKSITEEDYDGTVYDLQMPHEHNYMLHNGIVHNGGGRRNGSIAIYLEPWHADIEDFLELRKNHGDEDMKCRDLFYAMWVNDLFMERVKSNADWSLFCPNECPGLDDLYGEDFVNLYIGYELNGKARKVIKARDLWFKILDSQMETGTPYLCFKDAMNKKTNQKNLGTLKSSNLCVEIAQYSDDKETAVCNLASIALPSFVLPNKTFDFVYLHHVTKHVCYNLNQIIDGNYYPTQKCRESNLKHRPIGIGVQGLADTFVLLDMPFDSPEAKELNKQIFETMYHAALEQSNELAAKLGPYSSYIGSPAFLGQLQYDMWGITPSNRYDWDDMKLSIQKYGLRNSLLLAPMPTASTSQILGFNECFEPFTSNIYTRRTLAGEFVVVNKYLIRELQEMGQWNEKVKNNIVANRGSVQQLNFLSTHQKNKYKIVWEISMRSVIDLAADRGAFICQSQSMNLWQEDPTYSSLTSMHFYSWGKGLKTGMYYLRRKPKHQAQQFTIDPNDAKTMSSSSEEEICEMCSA